MAETYKYQVRDNGGKIAFWRGAADCQHTLTFGTPEELRPILATLNAPAELTVIEDGDHSFKVRKTAPLSQAAVFDFILDTVERWLRALR